MYPKPKPKKFDPLRYLAGYFDTVEVNSTFYRPAAPEAARKWAERVKENDRFRFALKLWRRFTHEREAAFDIAEHGREEPTWSQGSIRSLGARPTIAYARGP